MKKSISNLPTTEPSDEDALAAIIREGGPEPLVYRVPELAKMMKLSTAKTYELVNAQVLPSVRVGRSVRIPAARFRRWLENNTREGE